MGAPVPYNWLAEPPRSLVVGDGAYAAALAMITGSEFITIDALNEGPEPNERGGYPRVLNAVERVFLVVGGNQSAAEALRCHESLWSWMGKMTLAGDQHELAIVFIVPAGDAARITAALVAGLGLAGVDPVTAGHAFIPMDTPLVELLAATIRIKPMDLPPLRARQAADTAHTALRGLRRALKAGGFFEIREAASRVLAVFDGQDYLLDLFCRPSSHRHGNLLRNWLNELVTSGVTPQNADAADGGPLAWLSGPQDTPGT
jgi:hypothetical protein